MAISKQRAEFRASYPLDSNLEQTLLTSKDFNFNTKEM